MKTATKEKTRRRWLIIGLVASVLVTWMVVAKQTEQPTRWWDREAASCEVAYNPVRDQPVTMNTERGERRVYPYERRDGRWIWVYGKKVTYTFQNGTTDTGTLRDGVDCDMPNPYDARRAQNGGRL